MSVRGSRTILAVAVFMAFILLIAFTTKSEITQAGNEASRLAAVESIVESGTFAVDGSRFKSPDIGRVNGRFYSDKPPLLICWLAAVYGLLAYVFSINFSENYHTAVHLITLAGIGSFSILLSVLFFRKLDKDDVPIALRLLGGGAVVVATWIFSFGATVNNHTPAACLLFGLFCLFDKRRSDPGPRWCFGAGALAGALFNVDLPSGGLFFLAFGWLLAENRAYRRKALWSYISGFALLVLLMMALDYIAYGNVLPIGFITSAKDFPGSIHTQGLGGQRRPTSVLVYLLEITAGRRGLFSHTPVLLFAFPALLAAYKRRRRDIAALAGALIALLAFNGTFTGDYGGWAYGFRYMIPVIPILFWYSFQWFLQHRQSARAYLYWAALVVSLTTAAVGIYNPWPVIYEGASTNPKSLVRYFKSSFTANVLCIAYEWGPESVLGHLMIDRVYGRKLSIAYLQAAFVNKNRFDLAGEVRQRLR